MGIGDVFKVQLEDRRVRPFQHVAQDKTQLNSDVIRVFKRVLQPNEMFELQDVVSSPVDFHAHVYVASAARPGLWQKIGKADVVGRVDVIFRQSNEIGAGVQRSNDWSVWKVNEPMIHLGSLSEKYKEAEIGVVKNLMDIIERMRSGMYAFMYPEPDGS